MTKKEDISYRSMPEDAEKARYNAINTKPSKNGETLTPYELGLMFRVKMGSNQVFCPDCGGQQWNEGPSAGISTNYACANEDCGSRFNITLPVKWAERISIPQPLRNINIDKL
jgi:hypothetical protein